MFARFKNRLRLYCVLVFHRVDYYCDYVNVKLFYVHNPKTPNKQYKKKMLDLELHDHKAQVLRYEVMVREYFELCSRLEIDPYMTDLFQALVMDLKADDKEYRLIDAAVDLLTADKIRLPLYTNLKRLGDISPNRINELKDPPQLFYMWLNEM